MKKGAETVAKALITLFICIAIFFVAYVIFAQFFGATPELKALNNVKDGINYVCGPGGPEVTTAGFNLPADNSILLTPGGTVELLKSGKSEASKVLNCTGKITFAECSINSRAGKEYVSIEIRKQQDQIFLMGTGPAIGQVTCK